VPNTQRALLAVSIALLAILVSPAAALAQDETIRGTLEKIDGDAREPIPGVTITVELDGEAVGTSVSDDNGDWEVPVPGAGTYLVRLEVDTLPEGVALTDPERFELPALIVRENQNKTARFNLGPGLVAGNTSAVNRLLELFVIGLKLGAVIAMASIGLSLIFGVTGLVNFAHGELVTMGAVIAYFFHLSTAWFAFQWPLIVAAIPAVVLTAAFGWANEAGLWRPLRRRRVGLISMLVISIGLSFALRNVINIIFGGEPRTYGDFAVQQPIEVLGIQTVPKNLFIIVFTVVVLVGVGLFLQRTRTGTAMRAVADNRDLAESSGIDVERVITVTWVVGAGLAGLGGVLLGASETVQWDMGFKLLLLIFAAVVLGGLGTAYGAMVGAFIIGVTVEMSTYWLDPDLKNAVALLVLVVMLLIRPQGLLGTRERIG
jgi:branched-chain amino acid transport system permease protein